MENFGKLTALLTEPYSLMKQINDFDLGSLTTSEDAVLRTAIYTHFIPNLEVRKAVRNIITFDDSHSRSGPFLRMFYEIAGSKPVERENKIYTMMSMLTDFDLHLSRYTMTSLHLHNLDVIENANKGLLDGPKIPIQALIKLFCVIEIYGTSLSFGDKHETHHPFEERD